jgi:hypothetical protein
MIGQARDRAGALIPVVARYTISTRRSELRLEPMLSYRFGARGEYIVSAGVRTGYLLAGTYEQREGIASPDNAIYADGSRQRNESAGALRELNPVQIGISAGISYEIPFSEGVLLRPELGGSLGITSPVVGAGWHPHELRAGISLLYSPPGEQSSPLQQGD